MLCCLFKWWHGSEWFWLLFCTIFDNQMENQEFFWPWSNSRIQKYPRRAYEDPIGYPASSAASGCKYSSKDIIRKIHFVMTDSIVHNLNKVIEKVEKISYENCLSFDWFNLEAISFINKMYHWYFITIFLNIFNDPLKWWLLIILYFSWCVLNDWYLHFRSSTLLCNAHLMMMMMMMMIEDVQRKLKYLCQQMHNSLRKQKISDCFMVGIEFQNESFVLKAIKCLSNFINQEYSTKPWNHCNHFEEFIATK